jgi:AraC-like DNA-binding protein
MKLQIKYDIHHACKVILQENLGKLDIPFKTNGLGVELEKELSPSQHQQLESSLKKYGIEIINNPKNAIVQQIKDLITEMVYKDDPIPIKMSAYISDKMNLSYSYLSKIFSDETFTSIENFMILIRIERVKQLIIEEKMTFSEVAWKLNYSSVAHLSNQFKKTTGLTPTLFQKIIERRNQYQEAFNQPDESNNVQPVGFKNS